MKFKKGNSTGQRFDRSTAHQAQKKSTKARLRNKTGRELMRSLLEMRCNVPGVSERLSEYGLNEKDITNEIALCWRQIERAITKADTKAFEAIMKTAGYSFDKTELEIKTQTMPEEMTPEQEKEFIEFLKSEF